LPIYFGIFKARMLPKSNQNQIYLWVDAPRDYSSDKTKKIQEDITKFLLKKDYVSNVTSTI
jgi:multidrug efflux pump subunit AcrB